MSDVAIWCLTTSPDNIAKTAELGWKVQGIKSRRGKTAREMRPGDKIVYYVTKVSAFGAVVDVTGECYEDHEVIWTSKPGEDYPWRVEIRPEVTPAEADWVAAEDLVDALEFPRKWPRENWKLAFQGNVRAWPEADYLTVKSALEDATSGS